MDRRILILIAVFILGSASLFGYRKLYYKPGKIDYEIKPNGVIKAGDSIFFRDKTPDASRRKWDFGDGEYSIAESGNHVYMEPGEYDLILTSYGPSGAQTTNVNVNVIARETIPSGPSITGPAEVKQGVPGTWESSLSAADYTWMVEGDAALGSNIQKGRASTYVFKSAGERTIVLKTKGPDGIAHQKITVAAADRIPAAIAPTATNQVRPHIKPRNTSRSEKTTEENRLDESGGVRYNK